ncbi:MAG TPA: hypothetical protein ENH85_02560 [Candidatus Scalindua sp.]|nr:hypothetical protein [Candidatus Scalindua sp.]
MNEQDQINMIITNLDHKPEMAKKLIEIYDQLVTDAAKMYQKLNDGRSYLMQVEPKDITVEDSLEAFGFGRNGLNY